MRAGSGKRVQEMPSAFARVLQAVGPLPTHTRSDEISRNVVGPCLALAGVQPLQGSLAGGQPGWPLMLSLCFFRKQHPPFGGR